LGGIFCGIRYNAFANHIKNVITVSYKTAYRHYNVSLYHGIEWLLENFIKIVVNLLQHGDVEEDIMETISKLKPQYITDKSGKKTAVILPIREYEELVEDIQDLAIIAERREEPLIPHKEIVAKLKEDGYL